jgi:hypothetical protein
VCVLGSFDPDRKSSCTKHPRYSAMLSPYPPNLSHTPLASCRCMVTPLTFHHIRLGLSPRPASLTRISHLPTERQTPVSFLYPQTPPRTNPLAPMVATKSFNLQPTESSSSYPQPTSYRCLPLTLPSHLILSQRHSSLTLTFKQTSHLILTRCEHIPPRKQNQIRDRQKKSVNINDRG